MHKKQEAAGPEEYGIPANTLDPSISWKDVYWLQSITRLPIIIKGILTKEDAELAVEHGVQGIIVSNHGGRQLDGGPASVRTVSLQLSSVRFEVDDTKVLQPGMTEQECFCLLLVLRKKCVNWGDHTLKTQKDDPLPSLLEILQKKTKILRDHEVAS